MSTETLKSLLNPQTSVQSTPNQAPDSSANNEEKRKRAANNEAVGGTNKRTKKSIPPAENARGGQIKSSSRSKPELEGLEEDPVFAESSEDDEDNEAEDETEAFQISAKELALERVKVIERKAQVKSRNPGNVPALEENDNDYILPPASGTVSVREDDAMSDMSSVVDMSMLPSSEGEDVDKPLMKASQRGKAARDAKYQAERPAMASFTNEGHKEKTRVHPHAASMEDLNIGWPDSTHLVYPNQQWTISISLQQQAIKDVLHEGILLAIGLAIFQNGFAPSDKQLTGSRNSILSAARSLKHVQIANRVEHDTQYARHLTNYVTGQVGNMRGKLKEVAQELVPSLYGIHQVPVTDKTTLHANKPYQHPAIIAIMQKFFFSGNKSPGRRFRDTFSSISDQDDAKEIPQAMLGLVSVAVRWDIPSMSWYLCRSQRKDGGHQRKNEDFASANFNDQYELHMKFIGAKILKLDRSGKGKYHSLMARLYREANSSTSVVDENDSNLLPDLDFDGMED
ncbi:hypothetical protein DFJ43DRAFT_1039322 [Lentinula guzmanii]|uniref:DUF6532 domain-containing protein n=1 Tax=Lentinula guzmanii TaxID=2804957 RepID=A0AA38JCK8_9AGAR|nr:hypothetical protein DFJ43DRAFT_1044430 [Lentinula guzmanii]KAJ3732458.1 hypothetical protein DFJ43DRAFT_1039322 [Lentinula guzmanii]